jgi:hypothetical protein
VVVVVVVVRGVDVADEVDDAADGAGGVAFPRSTAATRTNTPAAMANHTL